METQEKNLFDQAAKTPSVSEVFAKETKKDVSAHDIFAANENLITLIENRNPNLIARAQEKTARTVSGLFSATNIVLIINMLAITALVAYLLLRKPAATVPTAVNNAATSAPTAGTAEPDSLDYTKANPNLDKAISWQVAEELYRTGKYHDASYVFHRLAENITANTASDEFIRDFLSLRKALSLHQMDYNADSSELFTIALSSGSPVVRAMANYHLAFIESRNKQYLSVRTRAYRVLALIRAFQDSFSPDLPADCYFMVAETLTRKIMVLSNASDTMPGKLWTDTMRIESIPKMDQEQLRTFLQAGVYNISEGALNPVIEKNSNLTVGSQWSAICMDAPLEELLARFGSATGMNMTWQNGADSFSQRSTTLYLPAASKQYVAEVAAGSAGLIARFSDDEALIYNPEMYESLAQYKDLLAREAISVWRYFLLRYRGDDRTANAHFALGLIQDHTDETIAALGEYKLVASRYSTNNLAPYALLNSSRLKTKIRDYTGATQDLTELIIQYPDFKMADQASLYLAEATMYNGLFDDAIRMFYKAYNLDINPQSQQTAAYGLANCFHKTEQYEKAREWFIHAIEMTGNASDDRLKPAYYMLGETYLQLGDDKKAADALKNAVDDPANKEQFVKVTLKLVEAEIRQENFVTALNTLENIPAEQLAQEHATEVLIKKATVFRLLDIPDTAISLLRHKIEFIADSTQRAKLSLELARCYMQVGDIRVAREELSDVISDMPPGPETLQAQLLLAEATVKLEEYDQARITCLDFLNSGINDPTIQQQALSLLGRCYTELNLHDKAALAYAGIFDRAVLERN